MTFKEVATHSDLGDRYVSLIRVMLVCRRWHNIVVGNTALWSDIIVSGDGSVSHALRSFVRSGESSLTVDLEWCNTTSVNDIIPLLERLADHSQRLASFKLVAHPFPPLLHWTSPAANLHTLTLRNRGGSQPLGDFIGGSLPRLRYLVLEGFHSWPAGRFHNLQTITLQIPLDRGTVPSGALLGLLKSSPGLRRFSISGCKRIAPLSSSPEVVILPRLTLLTIHTSSVHDILSHLTLPATAEIRLISCADVIRDLVARPPGFPSFALPTLSITLDVHQSTTTFKAFARGKSSPSLIVTEKFHSGFKSATARASEEYATVPAFPSVEELVLESNCTFQTLWMTWLSKFPALKRLTIRTRNPEAFRTSVHGEFGFHPKLYQTPEFSGTGIAEALHVDWGTTHNLTRHHLALRDAFLSPPLTHVLKPGIVARMKPRRSLTPGRGGG